MAGALSAAGRAGPAHRDGPAPAAGGEPARVVLAAVALALASGPLALLGPAAVAAFVAVLALGLAVALRPPVGAYALLASTPLLAGIDRGTLVPMLRPSEAVLGIVLAGLGARGLVALARGAVTQPRLAPLEWWLVALVVSGSVVPLLWMVARGREVAGDDVLYATYLCKYALVYAAVRVAVRTERQVHACLVISMVAAIVVGGLAILQSIGAGGVNGLLATLYSAGEDAQQGGRGTSTLSSSHAVADVMAFNVAIGTAMLLFGARRRGLLVAAIAVYVVATAATGQFSGYLGLLTAFVALGIATRRLARVLAVAVPSALIAAVALSPVIARRLTELDPVTGLPVSWVGPNGRWSNLTTYFWPDLFDDLNWLTGVRVAARVRAPEGWREWIWIESGHTWLLWSGGIALLVTCLIFLAVGIRTLARRARGGTDAVAAAALAGLTALWLNVVLLTLDVHLTLRGAGDLLFALLALAHTGWSQRPGQPQPTHGRRATAWRTDAT